MGGVMLGIEGLGAEEFVSVLLRYASDAIAVSDRASGRFVVVSDSYCALTGYARDELIGRTSVEIGLVADHATRSEALDRADQDLGAMYELRIRRKDGAIRLFEFSVQPLAGGLMVTISRDVTDRRRAQEDQARLAAIVQSSEDAIIGCTLDLVITSWNPGAERLYGYSAEEMIGRRAEILFPPEDREEDERVIGRIAAGERVEEHLTTRLRKDGRQVRVSVTGSPIFDATGTIVGVASVARDLTERERARARFRGLLEAAPVAIIAGDVHWRVALANAQAERLFGYPPGELVGQSVGDLFPGYVEAARAGRRPRFAADLAPGEVVALKLAARRRDGAEFFAEVSLTTIETDEGWLALAGVRDAHRARAGCDRRVLGRCDYRQDAGRRDHELEPRGRGNVRLDVGRDDRPQRVRAGPVRPHRRAAPAPRRSGGRRAGRASRDPAAPQGRQPVRRLAQRFPDP